MFQYWLEYSPSSVLVEAIAVKKEDNMPLLDS